MKPRKGSTVFFKLKRSYRLPILTGVVQNSTRKLAWITLKQVQGRPVKKEETVCVSIKNIY